MDLNQIEKKDLYKKIINHYGNFNQILKTVEELNELSLELLKYIEGKDRTDIFKIIEEIADVEFCIEKIIMIFNINLDSLKEMKELKIKRLLKRIENEGGFL